MSFLSKPFGRMGLAFGLSRKAPYMKGMSSALTAANRLLEIAKEKGISLTPLQLMKLTYMSHGWMLGITGKPLYAD